MQDWAALNGGYLARVAGLSGLAVGLDLAAAPFRTAKPYAMTDSLQIAAEPQDEGQLTRAAPHATDQTARPPAHGRDRGDLGCLGFDAEANEGQLTADCGRQ